MRKLFYTISILSVLVLASSCGKEEDFGKVPIIKATINGNAWETTNLSDAKLVQTPEINQQNLTVEGVFGNIKLTINIVDKPISSCLAIKSYNNPSAVSIAFKTSDGAFINDYSYQKDATENNIMSLTVTSCKDGAITGTFSGSYIENIQSENAKKITISNGTFENIPFEIIK